MGHDWQLDMDKSRFAMLDGFDCGVMRCSKCGCLKILRKPVFGQRMVVIEYKPADWTWNPFRVLREEPPCPARWP